MDFLIEQFYTCHSCSSNFRNSHDIWPQCLICDFVLSDKPVCYDCFKKEEKFRSFVVYDKIYLCDVCCRDTEAEKDARFVFEEVEKVKPDLGFKQFRRRINIHREYYYE